MKGSATGPDQTPDGFHIDDFAQAWRDFFGQHRDLLRLLEEVVRRTDLGAYSVELPELSTAFGRSVAETSRLVDEVSVGVDAWAHIRSAGDAVVLDLTSPRRPRYWYRIGEREVGVGGCAPDTYLVAEALAVPLRVESRCPATGTAIAIDFTHDGAVRAEPADAVVALLHPGAAPVVFQLDDPDQVDVDICLQQPFFASVEAAAEWLAQHPEGRVFPALEFGHWLRRVGAFEGGTP